MGLDTAPIAKSNRFKGQYRRAALRLVWPMSAYLVRNIINGAAP